MRLRSYTAARERRSAHRGGPRPRDRSRVRGRAATYQAYPTSSLPPCKRVRPATYPSRPRPPGPAHPDASMPGPPIHRARSSQQREHAGHGLSPWLSRARRARRVATGGASRRPSKAGSVVAQRPLERQSGPRTGQGTERRITRLRAAQNRKYLADS
jgi:hypothetical protein